MKIKNPTGEAGYQIQNSLEITHKRGEGVVNENYVPNGEAAIVASDSFRYRENYI